MLANMQVPELKIAQMIFIDVTMGNAYGIPIMTLNVMVIRTVMMVVMKTAV